MKRNVVIVVVYHLVYGFSLEARQICAENIFLSHKTSLSLRSIS